MKRSQIFAFLIFFLSLCGCAGGEITSGAPTHAASGTTLPSAKKTVIESKAEAKQLLGKHLFTDTNLCCRYISSYGYFGEAIVYEQDGLYRIHGGHEGYYRMRYHAPFRGGYLKIDGAITDIRTNSFTFEGFIETAELDHNNFYTCPRTGIFTFSRENHPAYWRLQAPQWPDHCPQDDVHLIGGGYVDLFSESIAE
ncbi:MAG: hypothetical protein H6858_01865 [Rhodospirillales bacterium]|nr:hypothetical protein [Rhodospirillales bacterium]